PATLKWAVDKIVEAQATPATVGNQLNQRSFLLGAVLKDGPSRGKSVSEAKALGLVTALWSKADRVAEMVSNGYCTGNPPGIGELGSASRAFGDKIGNNQQQGTAGGPVDPMTGEPIPRAPNPRINLMTL